MKKLLLITFILLCNTSIWALDTFKIGDKRDSTTFDIHTFRTVRGANQSEHDEYGQFPYMVEERSFVSLSITNNQTSNFKGKYAIALTASNIHAGMETGCILYESPSLDLEKDENLRDIIEMPQFTTLMQTSVIPIPQHGSTKHKFILLLQKEGETEWVVVKDTETSFDIAESIKGFFMQGNLESPSRMNLEEEFIVKAPIYAKWSDTPYDDFEIGLFKYEKINDDYLFTFNYRLIEIISMSHNEDTYTCKISRNVEKANDYYLFPIKKGSPILIQENTVSVIASNAYRPVTTEANRYIDMTYPFAVTAMTTNINENEQINLRFSPNPVKDILHIDGDVDPNTSIKVYNSIGKLVKSEINTTEIDFSDLPTGMYFVKIGEKTHKVIKD